MWMSLARKRMHARRSIANPLTSLPYFRFADAGRGGGCTAGSAGRTLRVLALTLGIICFAQQSFAEQKSQVFRIGFLTGNPANLDLGFTKAFLERMRELGYVEGTNISIEWRHHLRNGRRQRAMAAELAVLKPDVIVANGAGDIRALKEATATIPIPIVMVVGGDPIGNGFVKSLARPGGNITGCGSVHPELSAKRLEILKEIVPRLSIASVLVSSSSPNYLAGRKEIDRRAGLIGVTLQYQDVLHPNDLRSAFHASVKGRAGAILFLVMGPIVNPHVEEIADLGMKSRLPVIYQRKALVDAGGLISYGVDRADLFQCAATYVDRILKGAKPSELPVELPTKYKLRVNLKTARALGITIPSSILLRADEVIE